MGKISIVDLEVQYCIGVTEAERAKPQRLLLTIDMEFDFSAAAGSDRVEETINYQQVVDEFLRFGQGRTWKLLESLAANLADLVLSEFEPAAVLVEVKKFVIPQARYVSVSLSRSRSEAC